MKNNVSTAWDDLPNDDPPRPYPGRLDHPSLPPDIASQPHLREVGEFQWFFWEVLALWSGAGLGAWEPLV